VSEETGPEAYLEKAQAAAGVENPGFLVPPALYLLLAPWPDFISSALSL
jgi:hypothetical protein